MRAYIARVGVFNGRYWQQTQHFTVHASTHHVAAARAVQWAKRNDPLVRKTKRIEELSLHLKPCKEERGKE